MNDILVCTRNLFTVYSILSVDGQVFIIVVHHQDLGNPNFSTSLNNSICIGLFSSNKEISPWNFVQPTVENEMTSDGFRARFTYLLCYIQIWEGWRGLRVSIYYLSELSLPLCVSEYCSISSQSLQRDWTQSFGQDGSLNFEGGLELRFFFPAYNFSSEF